MSRSTLQSKLRPLRRKLRPLRQIFSGVKRVDNGVLNRLGVQVFRALAARFLYNLRSVPVEFGLKEKVEELRREGILILPDFLPADQFERLRQEYLQFFDEHENSDKMRIFFYGKTKTDNGQKTLNVRLHEFDLDGYPNIREFCAHPTLHTLLEVAEKRTLDPLEPQVKLQRLIQGQADEEDIQSELHSDIFFTTHKVWFYLNDIELKHGPFVYVKRSHRLGFKRLYYTYLHSNDKGLSSSRRIGSDEVKRMGFEETIFTCRKNTLVIGNTCGYHRRLRGQPYTVRDAIFVSVRFNPFWWKS